MLIELDHVRREPFHWQETRQVPPAELQRSELDGLGEIEWSGKVVFTDPGFYLTGHLGYDQSLICTRCLASFTEPVEADVELLLLVEEPPIGEKGGDVGGAGGRWEDGSEAGEHRGGLRGEEVELAEEDLGVLTLTGETFDTDPILREQLQLNIPMKPLCRPECKGLCPVCGTDRNEGECSCTDQPKDPRWQALAGLKERLGREGD